MKLGIALYRSMLTTDNFRFARQPVARVDRLPYFPGVDLHWLACVLPETHLGLLGHVHFIGPAEEDAPVPTVEDDNASVLP